MSIDRDALIVAMIGNGTPASDLDGVDVVAQYPDGISQCWQDLDVLAVMVAKSAPVYDY